MIDLDCFTIDFRCPSCDFWNEIFYKQARLCDVVVCRGCHRNIRLDDQMADCEVVRRRVRQAFQQLEQSFSNLEINLRF